ncbi:MAG TPA: hypothetical protein VFX70_20580 [Mycobacteriales bacterium]|nr:hypothetical protein [Mycobacteriales bacterium]
MGGGTEWYLRVPPPIVPVPAASYPDVCDQRVIISVPPGGFRYDMRAVTYPYVHTDGRVRLDVLAEHDWYRAYIRSEPVPTTRFPIDDVWVEHRAAPSEPDGRADPSAGVPAERTPAPGPDPSGRYAFLDRLVTLSSPPIRRPRRAKDADLLTGRRVVVLQPDGPSYDRRAVSEPYLNAESGDVTVNVCSEYDWYRWAVVREPPRVDPVEIYLLWVE